VPVAPEVTPTDVPVGPQQTEAEPEAQPEPPVEEKVEAPVVPQAEPLTMAQPPKPIETPPEKPKEKKPMQKHASLPTAPSAAEHRDVRAAAPMPGANSQNSNAVPTWRSQLVARLERYKRYPSDAHGDQGTATLGFSVDRSGGVHNARIVRSSGSGALDRETLALIGRAAPMPPPPPEAVGAQIAIVAPIRYNTR
jgi:protein TonB